MEQKDCELCQELAAKLPDYTVNAPSQKAADYFVTTMTEVLAAWHDTGHNRFMLERLKQRVLGTLRAMDN